MAAENDDGSNYVDGEAIENKKRAKPINTIDFLFIKILQKLSSINFIFTPSEITVRQCQCTTEINITNIFHKQA